MPVLSRRSLGVVPLVDRAAAEAVFDAPNVRGGDPLPPGFPRTYVIRAEPREAIFRTLDTVTSSLIDLVLDAPPPLAELAAAREGVRANQNLYARYPHLGQRADPFLAMPAQLEGERWLNQQGPWLEAEMARAAEVTSARRGGQADAFLASAVPSLKAVFAIAYARQPADGSGPKVPKAESRGLADQIGGPLGWFVAEYVKQTTEAARRQLRTDAERDAFLAVWDFGIPTRSMLEQRKLTADGWQSIARVFQHYGGKIRFTPKF